MLRKCTVHGESAQETDQPQGPERKYGFSETEGRVLLGREGSTTVQAARKQKRKHLLTEALQPLEPGAHWVEEVGNVVAKNQESSGTCRGKGAGRTVQQLEEEEATAV